MPPLADIELSKIVANVDAVLSAIAILENPYFVKLSGGDMSRDDFVSSQQQFLHAVDFFSRPMSALLMRLDDPNKRLNILANVVEEHGEFEPSAFHASTFRDFLAALGQRSQPATMDAPVHAFNSAIMAACLSDELPVGIACLGIIEYAFADISAIIGAAVVDRGWVSADNLVHYSLHAKIDKEHAADFFRLIADDWNQPTIRADIERGLRLGAYVFDRLYRDLIPVHHPA